MMLEREMGGKANNSATIPAILACQAADPVQRSAVSEAGLTLDWAAIEKRAATMAAQLASLGIGCGDRVAVWLPNGVDYVVAIFAVARRAAITVHVNTRFGAQEVGDLIERTGATVIVTQAKFPTVDFLTIFDSVPREKVAGVAVLCASADRSSAARLIEPWTEGWIEDIASPEDAALVYTTGGTTAKPKLVVHTQRSIAAHAVAVMGGIGLTRPGAALLAAVPFCGTFGNIALMSAVAAGAHIITMASFDERVADTLIRDHAISHLVGDDRMMARLSDVAEARGRYDSVQFTGVAGFQPSALDTFVRAAAVGLRPHAIYGSSEVQALFAIGDPAAKGGGPVVPTSMEASFEITSGDGELLLAGPSLFDRYLDDPGATVAAKAEGKFHSGDRARREGDGFVFDGRTGDILRFGGFLVSPLEIETFLQAQEGIAAAQVVAVESARGTVPFAFVLGEDGTTIDETAVLAVCRAMLARYKVPQRIVTLDAFPTSDGPNGPKIARAELRQMAAALMHEPANS